VEEENGARVIRPSMQGGQVPKRRESSLCFWTVMPVTAAAARAIVFGPRWVNRRCYVATLVATAAAPALPEDAAVPKT